ncbi:hypothetical protein GBA52_004146 [Prunus armeniaca]|nr:hypothetical protein GBA52_004146 [Prunus armeniaca]
MDATGEAFVRCGVAKVVIHNIPGSLTCIKCRDHHLDVVHYESLTPQHSDCRGSAIILLLRIWNLLLPPPP